MNTQKLLTKIAIIITLFCYAISIKAQSVAINTDGTAAATSALLDVKSTTQGILIPRMTAALRTAIATPATGLMVYQTDAPAGFYFYNGTAWTGVASQLELLTEGTTLPTTGYRILGRNADAYGNIGFNAMDLSFSNTSSTTFGATGGFSFASGVTTTASGGASTAMGNSTTASSTNSTAMGNSTTASGNTSTAMGNSTTASGTNSTAMGSSTTARGANSIAVGSFSFASGQNSTAMGFGGTASGENSTALGRGVTAASLGELSVGSYNTTYTVGTDGATSFNTADRAFGVGIGASATAKKDGFIVFKDGTLALDKLTAAPTTTTDRLYVLDNKLNYNGAEIGGGASQLERLTEGTTSPTTGYRILGRNADTYGNIGSNAMDLSYSNTSSTTFGATGGFSFASGLKTAASGNASTAMGNSTTASSSNSTAMGNFTTASSSNSTAMGNSTTASGNTSTAMGAATTASGIISTAIGNSTTASGNISTAMGNSTTASGNNSTAIGNDIVASSFAEVAVGNNNTTYTLQANGNTQHNSADRAFGVGIGAGLSSKADGLVVFKNGNTFISNNGNTPTNGNASTLNGTVTGTGVAALQVRASGSGLNIETGLANNSITIQKVGTPASGNKYISFGSRTTTAGSDFSEIGSISVAANGTSVAYSTSSDSRLKIDNGTYQKGLNTINNIKIHDYTWKLNSAKDVGVFAQELYRVFPLAVTKGDDDMSVTDIEKIANRWQVDYSKLVPVLVSAVQDLSKENDRLKQEIASLKSTQAKEMANLKSDIELIKASMNISASNVSSK